MLHNITTIYCRACCACSPRRSTTRFGAKCYTPEITQVKFHWKLPLNIHWIFRIKSDWKTRVLWNISVNSTSPPLINTRFACPGARDPRPWTWPASWRGPPTWSTQGEPLVVIIIIISSSSSSINIVIIMIAADAQAIRGTACLALLV